MASTSKPITPADLRRHALAYLNRFASTRAQLRTVLIRRLDSSLAIHGGDRRRGLEWIDAYLDELEQAGVLNDQRYAADRVEALRARGLSTIAIRTRLAVKGLSSELVAEALQGHDEAEPTDSDLAAAARYVRRRRLGPYRRPPEPDRSKDLARLGRAGFPYPIAEQVLGLSLEDIERLARPQGRS